MTTERELRDDLRTRIANHPTGDELVVTLLERLREALDRPPHPATVRSGRWFHASDADLPGGTILVPGGARPPSQSFYEQGHEERAVHLWVTPDCADAWFWATVQDVKYVYEVEPSNEPSPWNGTGIDGWTCFSATVIRSILEART